MSEKLKILIVDDEPAARTVLSFLLETCFPEANLLGEAGSAIEGIKMIQKLKPNLVFLDISMPHADGFDLLESLPERNFEVVFTTSHQQHAIQALREGAVDYLLKPVDEDDLIRAVDRVLKRIEESAEKESAVAPNAWEQKIKVSVGKETVYLPVSDILHLEAVGAYSKIYSTEGRVFTESRNLRHFETLLQPLPFFRTHNSHLVNLKKVTGFLNEDGGFVQMEDGSSVPVASRKVSDFHRAMKSFLR